MRAAAIGIALFALASCGSESAPPDHVLRTDSRDLGRTVVVATDRAPIADGKNVLWCAAFQLAWDAYRRDVLGGAPLSLEPPARADAVAALNAAPFPPGDLDPGAFVAMAGRGPESFERFRAAAKARFGDAASNLVEDPAVGPGLAAAFAFLHKDLPFEHRFADYGTLRFAGGRAVRAFGTRSDPAHPNRRAILGQVRLHASDATPGTHGRPDQFILELAVRGGRDRLLLARVDPAPTLRETWDMVRQRAAGTGEAVGEDIALAIPKLDFDVAHRFAELQVPGQFECYQRTRLRLDETGARLDAYAYAAKRKSPADAEFLFDRPFLVALLQKGASRPYLLLWIGNDELLMPE
jgi:hypothetical protein